MHCLNCDKTLATSWDVVKKSTRQGFETILTIAELGNDAMSRKMISIKSDIYQNP